MKLIKLLVMIGVIGEIILLTGCAGFVNKEKVVKDALENKYGEEMLIYSVDVQGSKFYAKCAPASNPEVVFETKIFSNGNEEWDDYYVRYVAKQLEKILEDDLEQFFPDAYYRAELVYLHMIDESVDFRQQTLEEIVANSECEDEDWGGLRLDIYVNNEVGSTQEYLSEYNYFTNTIDQYVEENRMIPLNVTIYWVDKAAQDRVREYFTYDLDYDTYFEKKVLGVERRKTGVWSNEGTDLGSPSNMAANFMKFMPAALIKSEEEYIRRRKLLENE